MKEKIKNSRIYKNNWIIGVAIIGIIGIIGYYKSNIIRNSGLYTVGNVYKTEGARSGIQVYYKYCYKGEKYESSFIGDIKSSEVLNKRFYVQFLANNPNKRRFYLDKPVPSCIKKVPFDGWETIPTKCDD